MYSVLCYGAFKGFNIFAGKHESQDTYGILTIKNQGNAVRVTAKIDTGNNLKEPFSQSPVIVIGRHTAESITPVEIREYETVTSLNYRTVINNVRFVPFTSVNGEGIMPCFQAEKIYLNDTLCDKKIYIALCRDNYIQGDFQAILPYELF